MIGPLKGVAFHISLVALYHLIGAVLLAYGVSLLATPSPIWGWLLVFLALNFYGGALLFLCLAKRDARKAMARGLREILAQDTSEQIVLSATRLLWPIVLFPWGDRGHAVSYTGTRWLPGIKAGFGFARAHLTNQRILVEAIFPRVPIVEILLVDVRSAQWLDQRRDLIEIRYDAGRYSALTNLLAFSGSPVALKDSVLLNIGEQAGQWLEALSGSNH